jgi:hypothetical protein
MRQLPPCNVKQFELFMHMCCCCSHTLGGCQLPTALLLLLLLPWVVCREQCLHNAGFTDIFKAVKQTEDEAALQLLPQVGCCLAWPATHCLQPW